MILWNEIVKGLLCRYGGEKTDSCNQGIVLVVLVMSISCETSWCVFLFTQYSLPTVNRELKDCDCDQTNHLSPKKDKCTKPKKGKTALDIKILDEKLRAKIFLQ